MLDRQYKIVKISDLNESVDICENNFSDYELYQILEQDGYKTTEKNLQILKEGIKSNRYWIRKYDLDAKKLSKKVNFDSYAERYERIQYLEKLSDEYPFITDLDDPRINTLEKFRFGDEKQLFIHDGKKMSQKELENAKSNWGFLRGNNVEDVTILARGTGKSIDGRNIEKILIINCLGKNRYLPYNYITKKGKPSSQKIVYKEPTRIKCHSLEDAIKAPYGTKIFYKGKWWDKSLDKKYKSENSIVSELEPEDRKYVNIGEYILLGRDDVCGTLFTDRKRVFYLNHESVNDEYDKLIEYEKSKKLQEGTLGTVTLVLTAGRLAGRLLKKKKKKQPLPEEEIGG